MGGFIRSSKMPRCSPARLAIAPTAPMNETPTITHARHQSNVPAGKNNGTAKIKTFASTLAINLAMNKTGPPRSA